MTIPTCKGVTKTGKPCSYRGRHHDYCKIHAAPGTLCDTGKKMGDCPICYEEVTKGTSTTTRCKHVFHQTCLQRWMEEKPTCPMCRENIRPTTGQIRPLTPPLAREPIPITMIVHHTGPDTVTVGIHRESPGVNQNVHYINSERELDNFLISVRNVPIDIRFTDNFWEAN